MPIIVALGSAASTVGVRLMRAHRRLKASLTGRGISRADGLLVAGSAAGTGSAVLPGSLVRFTAGAAVRIASGGTVPLAAAQLTNGVHLGFPVRSRGRGWVCTCP